jgi:YHS domain-containing protein
MADKMRDPVCDIDVHKDEARRMGLVWKHQGTECFFSPPDCCRRFREDPDRYSMK